MKPISIFSPSAAAAAAAASAAAAAAAAPTTPAAIPYSKPVPIPATARS